MNIKGTFIFHRVGQGLFYSGCLQTPDNKVFSFVYDCGCLGSKPSLTEAVKLYRKTSRINSSKKLHLLILSHLHADHINGLKELLKDDVKVDTMVIPYFSEDSKQIARIGSDRRDRFLQRFYDDPFDLPVRRILIIGTPESEQNTGEQNFTIDTDEPSGQARLYAGNHVAVNYRQLWKFSFENMPFPQSEIDSYVKWLLAQGSGRSLGDLLQDTKFVRNLRKETKNTFHTSCAKSLINRTSVMMLHNPITEGLHEKRCKTFLTGDVELCCGDSVTIIDEISQSQKHDLLVLQYPHHGGYCGCMRRFLNLQAKYSVLSYGLKNRYGHPNSDVISALNAMRTVTVHVNEGRCFCYGIIA